MGTDGRGGVQVRPMQTLRPPGPHHSPPEHLTPALWLGGGAQILIAFPPANRPSHPKGHPARQTWLLGHGSLDLGGRTRKERPEFQKPRPAKETSAPPDSV